MIARRSFFLGFGAAICAPAIIRPGILMPVKKALLPETGDGIALKSVAHPHTIPVWVTPEDLVWVPAEALRPARINDARILGVVGRILPPDSGFFLGDVVSIDESAPIA